MKKVHNEILSLFLDQRNNYFKSKMKIWIFEVMIRINIQTQDLSQVKTMIRVIL